MNDFVTWLLHDDQKNLFEILFALALGAVFLALSALLLWPLDRLPLAWDLAQGYAVLWIVLGMTIFVLQRVHHWLRMDIYHRAYAFVVSNLVASCLLQSGWSAFAALAIHRFAAGAPIWVAVILYVIGTLSCFAAFFAVTAIFQGAIYKFGSLPVALVCFAVFCVWPASGRAVYGWFFQLF